MLVNYDTIYQVTPARRQIIILDATISFIEQHPVSLQLPVDILATSPALHLINVVATISHQDHHSGSLSSVHIHSNLCCKKHRLHQIPPLL